MATRLELRYSKNEILAYYASNAPFGGNVVGLDAASWRFFNRKSTDLSWAEAATLVAVSNYTKKDETKMLKYALKLSEIEYKTQQNKIKPHLQVPDSYESLPSSPTFEAEDIDFLD